MAFRATRSYTLNLNLEKTMNPFCNFTISEPQLICPTRLCTYETHQLLMKHNLILQFSNKRGVAESANEITMQNKMQVEIIKKQLRYNQIEEMGSDHNTKHNT